MNPTEHSIAITRHARYSQLGTCTASTKRLWFVLHGYGQLASYFIKHFEPCLDDETCIIAPEGLSRFYLDNQWNRVGATWMTKEDRLHEISDYIAYLDTVLAHVQGPYNPELVLLGFSQGTATAWRWMMQGLARPSQLILWAGAPAMDNLQGFEAKLRGCPLHLVLGDQDEYVTLEQARKQLEALKLQKPDSTMWEFEGTHRMDAETLHRIIATF